MKKSGSLSRIARPHSPTKLPTKEYSPKQHPVNKLSKKPTKERKVIHRLLVCG
jgi:hypothetical protein